MENGEAPYLMLEPVEELMDLLILQNTTSMTNRMPKTISAPAISPAHL